MLVTQARCTLTYYSSPFPLLPPSLLLSPSLPLSLPSPLSLPLSLSPSLPPSFSPSTRPSAAELLKHPFFKKARNKEYVKDVVVGDAPSLASRAKKVSLHGTWSNLSHPSSSGLHIVCIITHTCMM